MGFLVEKSRRILTKTREFLEIAGIFLSYPPYTKE